MDLDSSTLQAQLRQLADSHITSILQQKLDDHVKLVEEVRGSLEQFMQTTHQGEQGMGILKLVREMKSFKDAITQSVNEHTPLTDSIELTEDFQDFFKELQEITELLPKHREGIQEPSHFQVNPNDGLLLRIGKRVKGIGLAIDHLPQKLANGWRRLRNQPEKPLKPWSRKIPELALFQWYFRDQFFNELQTTIGSVYRTIATSTDELWQIESKLDQDFEGLNFEDPTFQVKAPVVEFEKPIANMLVRNREQKDLLQEKVHNALDRAWEQYHHDHHLAGTLELPTKRFDQQKLQRNQKEAEKQYKKSVQGWSNTIVVLNDHYNLDQELYQLRYAGLEQYFFTSQKLDLKISDKIQSALKEISEYLQQRKQCLEQAQPDPAVLSKAIKEVRYDLARSLKQQIPQVTKLIFDQNIPALIDNLEVKVKNQVSELSSTRSVVKDITYEREIQSSEIDQISPRELIAFEALPTFLKDIKSLKSELVHELDNTQQQLSEIAEICDFNLATALAAMDETPEEDRDPKTLALEGVERAIGRLTDIGSSLSELNHHTSHQIRDSVIGFNQSVHALNEIQKVFDIKVRIAKAKAVEKTKELKTKVIDYVKGLLPRLMILFKRKWLLVNKYYQETSKKYGIASPSQNLSAEVSSFLNETDAAVSQLPYVYQRLFEIAPLQNVNFYEMRSQEIQKLLKAYQNWEQGKYAATALIGEAGSGSTTLTNFFLEELKNRHHTLRTNSYLQVYQEADFLSYFQKLFDCDPFEDLDQLVDYLNGLDGKRIIIVENLQHFYLRKVNGFACLKMFYELISRTNQNIFWLTTINLYAYHYLNKTSQIQDFFAYSIFMQPLKDEQVTNIVLRRHRVSGYNTQFKPSKYDRNSSRFKKMTEKQQQQYLQKEYFSGLNKLANSNITVALIYWLRSTLKVEEDTITIGSMKDIDFSFLNNLSSEKLFTLHALILHDGINIEDHARVFQQALEKSKLVLILLYEDGIIIRKDQRYFINPLLYRQVVNILKSKNFLH